MKAWTQKQRGRCKITNKEVSQKEVSLKTTETGWIVAKRMREVTDNSKNRGIGKLNCGLALNLP